MIVSGVKPTFYNNEGYKPQPSFNYEKEKKRIDKKVNAEKEKLNAEFIRTANILNLYRR